MPSDSGIMSFFRNIRSRVLKHQEDDEKQETASFLAGVPLFSSLSRGMLVHLAEAAHHRTYRRDEFVFYQGDPGIGLFVIRSGSARILVEGTGGQLMEIRTAGEGEVLGLDGLVGDGNLRRGQSVQAVTDSSLIGIFSPGYRTLQRRHPKTGSAVSALLARHAATVLSETQTLMAEGGDPVAAASLVDSASERAAAGLKRSQGL